MSASWRSEAGGGTRRGAATACALLALALGLAPARADEGAVTVGVDESDQGTSIVVDAGEDAVVRLFADVTVPAGQTVPGDVVTVFGSADVSGAVEGDVVAVLGSVRLHPGARVEGDAVAVGGVLEQPAGALVGGQSVAIGGLWSGCRMPTTMILLLAMLAGWLATLLLAWLLDLFSSVPMMRIGGTASRHSAGSFFLGLVSAPFLLLVVAFVVLVAAVAGAVLAVPVLLLGLLLPWVGQVAGTYVLGCKLLRRRPGESRLVAPVLAGSLLVVLLFLVGAALSVPAGAVRSLSLFFAMLGLLFIAGLSTLGTGAMLLSLMGTRPAPSPPAGPEAPPRG